MFIERPDLRAVEQIVECFPRRIHRYKFFETENGPLVHTRPDATNGCNTQSNVPLRAYREEKLNDNTNLMEKQGMSMSAFTPKCRMRISSTRKYAYSRAELHVSFIFSTFYKEARCQVEKNEHTVDKNGFSIDFLCIECRKMDVS